MEASATPLCSKSMNRRGGGAIVGRRGSRTTIGIALILVFVGPLQADEFPLTPQSVGFGPNGGFAAGTPLGRPSEPAALGPMGAAPEQPPIQDLTFGNDVGPPAATFSDRLLPTDLGPNAENGWELNWLPQGLLWHPPLANPREPRCYVTFGSIDGQHVVDTSIGATFGLLRYGPVDRPQEGFQIDVFADMFTRFAIRNALTAADYRAGVPLTFAIDNWQMKLSYEHSGCHLGDEYMLLGWNYGVQVAKPLPTDVDRDEAVFGIARVLYDSIRLYGQVGYSFTDNDALLGESRARYDWGVEYSPPSFHPLLGGPFAAFDMDLRGENDFFPGITVQTGWQWKTREKRRSSARVALTYYNGLSPFGQFYGQREDWYGFTAIYEW